MASDLQVPLPAVGVFLIRGRTVVIDTTIAERFGVETRVVNQAVARNPHKFTDEHVFELTAEEAASLKSQVVISSGGHGGRRSPLKAYTAKGVARLATILDTPEALAATDLIIDTFIEVQHQIAGGRSRIAISRPSRLIAEDEDDHRHHHAPDDDGVARTIRSKLAKAVSTLLDTVIDTEKDKTVRQASQALASGALAHVQERLKTRGLENDKLEADTALVLAEAEKLMAEARKTNAEADGIDIDNISKRIGAVRELMALSREAEPQQFVQLLTHMSNSKPTPLLPAPQFEKGA
jgi:DNA mismatch repair ATPase MutL